MILTSFSVSLSSSVILPVDANVRMTKTMNSVVLENPVPSIIFCNISYNSLGIFIVTLSFITL